MSAAFVAPHFLFRRKFSPLRTRTARSRLRTAAAPLSHFGAISLLFSVDKTPDFYYNKLRIFAAGLRLTHAAVNLFFSEGQIMEMQKVYNPKEFEDKLYREWTDNNYFRAEGKAFYGMVGITAGGVLNIVLDPIFIFTFGLGTAGAAIATALSQFISFIILLILFLKGKSNLRLSIKYVSFKSVYYRNILVTGLPTLARQGLASLASIALNVMAATYGDAAVAAMSIANRITFFLFSFMLGLGQGFQPVAAFNYGAKRYDRVHDATKFTSAISTLLMIVVAIICFIFARPLIMLFRRDDLDVISIGVVTLRAQSLALILTGITTVTNMALQSTGQAGRATLLAMCRQGFFFIPLVLILPHFIGLLGVQLAQSIADVLTFLVSLYFYITYLKELNAKRNAQVAEDLTAKV